MRLGAKPPVFVPARFRHEIEQMSKAALMDLVWDFATTATGEEADDAVMATLRERAGIVKMHRGDR